jgi:hypothetical protein
MGSAEPFNGAAPSTVQQSFVKFTFAPSAVTARNVAFVSSETNGRDILEVPCDNDAVMSILCV